MSCVGGRTITDKRPQPDESGYWDRPARHVFKTIQTRLPGGPLIAAYA